MRVFHIAEPDDWAEAVSAGAYAVSTRGASLVEVGYLHASRRHQVAGVLAALYADVTGDLLLLVIETDRLTARWQLDDVPGSAEPFPHIYGPLNIDAVVDTLPLTRGQAGWVLPGVLDDG